MQNGSLTNIFSLPFQIKPTSPRYKIIKPISHAERVTEWPRQQPSIAGKHTQAEKIDVPHENRESIGQGDYGIT